jgi:hypothetical protein
LPILNESEGWREVPLRYSALILINPVRNFSGALNPTGIMIKSNTVAEQGGIISNGVKKDLGD